MREVVSLSVPSEFGWIRTSTIPILLTQKALLCQPRRAASNTSTDRGLGLLLRSPNAVMNAGFMGIFPLTFLSNVFVDPRTLPPVLEAFVDVNPISILATASRGLMEGNAEAGDIAIVLAVAAALTAVFAPLTTRLYRRG